MQNAVEDEPFSHDLVTGHRFAPNTLEQMQLALDLAKLGGMKDLVPASEILSTQFTPVPTKF